MPDQKPEGRRVRVLHDAIGPGYNRFLQGQVVPVEALHHTVTGMDAIPTKVPWDVQRMIDLGALEYTDEDTTAEHGSRDQPEPVDAAPPKREYREQRAEAPVDVTPPKRG